MPRWHYITFHGVQKYHPPPNYGFNFDGIDDIVDCGDIYNNEDWGNKYDLGQ